MFKSKLIVVAKIFVALLITTASFATTENKQELVQKSTTIENPYVVLYAEPNTKRIIKKIALNARLIPIYKKDQWLEVGDPSDGQTGWINLPQYQQARYNYYRSDIQTIYVQSNNDHSRKPVINVIAYKNGKQLSQQEAAQMYQQLRAQQEKEWRRMQAYSRAAQQMTEQDILSADRIFNSIWLQPLWVDPIVILPAKQNQLIQKKNAVADDAGAKK